MDIVLVLSSYIAITSPSPDKGVDLRTTGELAEIAMSKSPYLLCEQHIPIQIYSTSHWFSIEHLAFFNYLTRFLVRIVPTSHVQSHNNTVKAGIHYNCTTEKQLNQLPTFFC